MRQRLGLAAALLRAPRLLVLDEPTNGLDPHGMREVRDLLAGLARGGTTVFLSSHLLAEIELVCTRAAIVHGVRLGERRGDRLAVHLDGTAPETLNRRLVDGGVRVRELVVERATLEDVFLRLTGGPGAAPGPASPADPPGQGRDPDVPG
jgi:ABC-2 type transport system ATP-binding protein